MNYVCYDKKNCLKWTKRINKSVRDRIVVCFLSSGTRTRRVMEKRERYELFSMLYTGYNKQLNSPWQHSIMPYWKTSAHSLVPNPLRGASLGLLPNLHSRPYKTYVVPGQGRRTYGTDRDVGWHLSLEFILSYRLKIRSWLSVPSGVKIESFASCHMVCLCVFMWFPL